MVSPNFHEVAQYNLSLGYELGEGVPKSKRKMLYWLRISARAGHPDAMRDLGFCLHEGFGTRTDYGAAAKWYRRAAKAGDRMAEFNLGLCYRDGHGVSRSRRWARYWLGRASAGGHRRARRLLNKIKAGGEKGSDPFFSFGAGHQHIESHGVSCRWTKNDMDLI